MPLNGDSIKQKAPCILRRENPAEVWLEAFPLGNGRIGLMDYGNVLQERMDISELTCWAGKDEDNYHSDAPAAFERMREAVLAGDYNKAHEEAKGCIGTQKNYGTNLPAGGLTLRQIGSLGQYSHMLDMESALSTVEYQLDGCSFTRQSFVSEPASGAVVAYAAQKKNSLCVSVGLDCGENPGKVQITQENDLLLQANAYESTHSDVESGVAYQIRLRLITDGELVQGINAQELQVKNASCLTILLAVSTSFLGGDYSKACLQTVDKMQTQGLPALRQNHSKDFASHFSACWLRLGGAKQPEQTNAELLWQVKSGGGNDLLTSLQFQYGRYLLLSSSRASSPLPAHLQGVWNDYVAARIGWTCDMHLDINTQMNYWPAGVANLQESALPLVRWIEEELVPAGRKTAKQNYGMPGWAAELVANAWGFAAPYWHPNLAPCPGCGAWTVTHVWDYYAYSGDEDYLRKHAYPVLKESAEFFLAYLFELPDGSLASGPSISPENHFIKNGKRYSLDLSPTFEIVMIRQIFLLLIEAAEILALEDKIVLKVRGAINKLPPYTIGAQGELQEWSHNYEEADTQHRHTSHLLGLYPYRQITPKATPELAKAAQKTIELRMQPAENWEDTGWARSMLLLYAARLYDAAGAYRHVTAMQTQLTRENLMVVHPPTRGAPSFAEVYEMDGNTGLVTGVCEMLLQSDADEIVILPALPQQWAEGEVHGLRTANGCVVDIAWEAGTLLRVVVYFHGKNKTIKLRYKTAEIKVETGTKLQEYVYNKEEVLLQRK